MKNIAILVISVIILLTIAVGVAVALYAPTIEVPEPPIDVENPPVGDDADVPTGLILFDENDIKIILKSYVYPSIKLSVENNTDKDVIINVNNVLVNEVAVVPSSEISVPAGATEKEEITWLAEDLENNSISAIENVKFYFSIMSGIETITTSDIIEIVLN